ncbi:Os12g0561750, partial [Oryza sativa Japonica Group]
WIVFYHGPCCDIHLLKLGEKSWNSFFFKWPVLFEWRIVRLWRIWFLTQKNCAKRHLDPLLGIGLALSRLGHMSYDVVGTQIL